MPKSHLLDLGELISEDQFQDKGLEKVEALDPQPNFVGIIVKDTRDGISYVFEQLNDKLFKVSSLYT